MHCAMYVVYQAAILHYKLVWHINYTCTIAERGNILTSFNRISRIVRACVFVENTFGAINKKNSEI
jgi:hypothetical protein